MQKIIKIIFILGTLFLTTNIYANQIFAINHQQSNQSFPIKIGLYDSPLEFIYTVTNNSEYDMPAMTYHIPKYFTADTTNTTCGPSLASKSSCNLAFRLIPTQTGSFSGHLKVCGGAGIWCSKLANPLHVTVQQNYIVSTNCNQIVPRPFADLTCNSSWQYANNFKEFMSKVLNVSPTHQEYYYYQHKLSTDETATDCLQARQSGVGLNPNIHGGGTELCKLMGYANANANPTASATDDGLSKLFPPYLNFLLGSNYPVTTPLASLASLLQDFNTSAMDNMVQNVGYSGYEDFLTDYLRSQVNKNYTDCGAGEVCPAISYLPYKISDALNVLQIWPINNINYWGISGGGGSGAGYQIQAFMPGSTIHYTLYTGGGGGGGGQTTPEISGGITNLINAGSGGGGGSQFADCYFNNNENLNGLGLGAGTGSGISTQEGTNFSYQTAPAVQYSFLKPTSHPNWDNDQVLSAYGDNLTYLFSQQIPELYNQGYTIVISGGGGGGTGLEYLDRNQQEFTPHALSIGHGFSFCTAFNINHDFRDTDCIPSPTITPSSRTLNDIIYQNTGRLFYQGMQQAILPQNCNGYQNSVCTCNFQYAYVVAELGNILVKSGFSRSDIPKWLDNPHCNHNQSLLALKANQQNSNCNPPWN